MHDALDQIVAMRASSRGSSPRRRCAGAIADGARRENRHVGAALALAGGAGCSSMVSRISSSRNVRIGGIAIAARFDGGLLSCSPFAMEHRGRGVVAVAVDDHIFEVPVAAKMRSRRQRIPRSEGKAWGAGRRCRGLAPGPAFARGRSRRGSQPLRKACEGFPKPVNAIVWCLLMPRSNEPDDDQAYRKGSRSISFPEVHSAQTVRKVSVNAVCSCVGRQSSRTVRPI